MHDAERGMHRWRNVARPRYRARYHEEVQRSDAREVPQSRDEGMSGNASIVDDDLACKHKDLATLVARSVDLVDGGFNEEANSDIDGESATGLGESRRCEATDVRRGGGGDGGAMMRHSKADPHHSQ